MSDTCLAPRKCEQTFLPMDQYWCPGQGEFLCKVSLLKIRFNLVRLNSTIAHCPCSQKSLLRSGTIILHGCFISDYVEHLLTKIFPLVDLIKVVHYWLFTVAKRKSISQWQQPMLDLNENQLWLVPSQVLWNSEGYDELPLAVLADSIFSSNISLNMRHFCW